jgi:hypothetical protein
MTGDSRMRWESFQFNRRSYVYVRRSIVVQHWVAAVFFAVGLNCKATSIVTVISSHGIVVGADGKVVHDLIGGRPEPLLDTKAFLIRGRFVIAHAGIRHFDLPEDGSGRIVPRFSFDDVIAQMRNDTSPWPDVRSVAELVRSKLIQEYNGFDTVPRSGLLHPDDLTNSQHNVITRLTIAGLDKQGPHQFEVRVEMDWPTLSHHTPPIITIYPSGRINLSCHVHGESSALREVMEQPDSFSRKQLMEWMPEETNALLQDHDLGLFGMARLARGLLRLQAGHDPGSVGYPFTVISIPPKAGRVTTRSYNKQEDNAAK